MAKTITINNWQGNLTRYNDGDINSGAAKYSKTFGNDPFTNPGNLTWFEATTRIDAGESVITDLIMAARPRLESGVTYVYAIGHTGRLYKIQVNDPTTYDPDYDNPVLLATLTAESPTFKYGSSIEFFGTSEQIYIGHDKGVTRINFAGTGEAFVGTQASYTSDVPRPLVRFNQYLYAGNGENLVQIAGAGTVDTYGVLAPALFRGTQVRDLDVAPEGNYIEIISSRVAQADMTTNTQDTQSLSSADSYYFLWNGEVDGNTEGRLTAYNSYLTSSLNANQTFGALDYTIGYDLGGAAVYSQGQKILSLPETLVPNFNSLFGVGNMVGFAAPENDLSAAILKGSMLAFGAYDMEIPQGLYRWFRISATDQTDIQQMPTATIVTNLFYGTSSAGYTNNKVGSAKIYFSTLETDNTPTSKFKLYKFTTVPTGTGNAIGGVYETQTQLFSKKATIKEIRFYVEPLKANNSFKIDIIGSDGNVMTNGSKTFTAGTAPVVVGDDYLWWNPQVAPTYAVGIRITNLGTANWVGTKLEIDVEEGGIC